MDQPHATLADIVTALRAHSMAATIVEADPERHVMAGINVWEGPEATGYAYTTVYPPANGSGWVWGHQYQHGAPDHVDAKYLADQISQTIFADPRPPRS